MGRAQYKTSSWDDYAFMVWLWGASRTGKTLVNFTLSQFFPRSSVVEMTTQGETTFGKEALINKSLIWFTDPKKPKNGAGFPIEVSELQTLIEGGRTSVPRKNKSALNNHLLNGAAIADSNKKPAKANSSFMRVDENSHSSFNFGAYSAYN